LLSETDSNLITSAATRSCRHTETAVIYFWLPGGVRGHDTLRPPSCYYGRFRARRRYTAADAAGAAV